MHLVPVFGMSNMLLLFNSMHACAFYRCALALAIAYINRFVILIVFCFFSFISNDIEDDTGVKRHQNAYERHDK